MYKFSQPAPGIRAFTQPPFVWYSNSGAIIGENDLVIIDSLTNQDMAGNMIREIRKVTDKPFSWLINTHSHADHVYTNHLFPGAVTLSSVEGRKKTGELLLMQERHDAAFRKLFPGMDFTGGRYTVQDISFHGSLTLYQEQREIRVIELGPGHSESDVIVFLPQERIVFCGDVFMNGMPVMPMEGHLSGTIANLKKLEELNARIYIPGHGDPAGSEEVAKQRSMLESLALEVRACYDQGMSYDQALDHFSKGALPPEFSLPVILAGYCEWSGKMPVSNDPDHLNHLQILRGIASRTNPF